MARQLRPQKSMFVKFVRKFAFVMEIDVYLELESVIENVAIFVKDVKDFIFWS